MSKDVPTRTRARADRVNQACNLGELLSDYGYAVVPDEHREQQFACTLHGRDGKPSARYYPVSNSTYCWVCQKTRDPIAYVMEHESVEFPEAIRLLEQRIGLDPLPWDDDDGVERPRTEVEKIEEMALRRTTYAAEKERTQKLLDGMTRDRDLDAPTLLLFWEVFDRVDHGMARESWPESKGITALEHLRQRAFEKLGRSLSD
jgi:hypothetical protein